MSKTLLIISCFVCLILAHKDPKPHNQLINSIYQPFTDVPKPAQEELPAQTDVSEEISHNHDQLPADKQKQYEEFNEMLKYGLILGTLLLSAMLVKTCSINGRRLNNPRMLPMPSQDYMIRAPILNRNLNAELKNKIHWHQCEIKKLEQEWKQLQEAEKKAMQESKQVRRNEVIKVSSNQMQMQETMPASYYSQQMPYHYEYYNNIPMGRPLARDNDSSFASEYPTI